MNVPIVILGIILMIIFWRVSLVGIYTRGLNALINCVILILLLVLPESMASILFCSLVLRGLAWLFGPSQDAIDDYHYSRYRNAKDRYERKK